MDMRQRHLIEPNHPDDNSASGCLLIIGAILLIVLFKLWVAFENTRVFLWTN